MKWFEGWTAEGEGNKVVAKCLIEALDAMSPSMRPIEKDLRLPIGSVHIIPGVGTIISGYVECGILQKDMSIIIGPSGITARVEEIEIDGQAQSGEKVFFKIEVEQVKKLSRGLVAGDAKRPPRHAVEFTAHIIILGIGNSIKVGNDKADELLLDCHTGCVSCKVVESNEKFDSASGENTEKNPKNIVSGEAAIVVIHTMDSLCIELFNEFPPLGRFALRKDETGKTIAAGVITSIETNNTVGLA